MKKITGIKDNKISRWNIEGRNGICQWCQEYQLLLEFPDKNNKGKRVQICRDCYKNYYLKK